MFSFVELFIKIAKKNLNATKRVLTMHTMTNIKQHYISTCHIEQLVTNFINMFRNLSVFIDLPNTKIIRIPLP